LPHPENQSLHPNHGNNPLQIHIQPITQSHHSILKQSLSASLQLQLHRTQFTCNLSQQHTFILNPPLQAHPWLTDPTPATQNHPSLPSPLPGRASIVAPLLSSSAAACSCPQLPFAAQEEKR
jgi:hypothetical protein